MKINILPISSSLHSESVIESNTKNLIGDLEKRIGCQINIVSKEELYNADLSLILVQSGGSEGVFLELLKHLKEPFYLLTYGNNNSLAASLEILSYLRDNNLAGEVLHGSNEYISNRIKGILKPVVKYGVIGKPSDWLIASKVDYSDALKHNVSLVNIDIKEVEDIYNSVNLDDYSLDLKLDYKKEDLDKAKRMYLALNKIKEKYNLSGLTIRCFDLLFSLKTTACLGLSILNSMDIVSACEGDIPAMISMHVLKTVTGQVGFQANPSRIDAVNSEMIIAHCTLPLNMAQSYTLDSHFESGIGVAIRAKLKEEKVTIFKLAKDLKNYFVTTGTIIENLCEDNLCRTQIKIKVDSDITYFLNRPYGNHHIIVYGDHKKEIEDYMSNIK